VRAEPLDPTPESDLALGWLVLRRLQALDLFAGSAICSLEACFFSRARLARSSRSCRTASRT